MGQFEIVIWILLILIFLSFIIFISLLFYLFEPLRKYYKYKWHIAYKEEFNILFTDYQNWKKESTNYSKFSSKSASEILDSYKSYLENKRDNISGEIFDRIRIDISLTKQEIQHNLEDEKERSL